MSFEIYSNNSNLRFFNPDNLRAERELIDSWDYEIINQYGMDCLIATQKHKFPSTKADPKQNDLFFHAYGEITNADRFNDPFSTRCYVQYSNDLFALNGFGLSMDSTLTLLFNRTSFALDAALSMGDDKVINKKFKFKAVIDPNTKNALINFKGKDIQFKASFDWAKALESIQQAELVDISIDQNNYVSPDVIVTFKRRYSAKDYIKENLIYVQCTSMKEIPMNGKVEIEGKCHATFVTKNPWKPFTQYLNKLCPSVGDIVMIRSIDDKVIKLELTEVVSENKTIQGINPLFGAYSYSCTAKPYIAENNASSLQDPLIAPTEINANKLIIQTILNHDASTTAGNISEYDKLYIDEDGFNFTEDDVYGGYDLEKPHGLGTPTRPPIKHEVVHDNNRYYKWTNDWQDKELEIKAGNKTLTYTPDILYTYLKNLMDSNYIDYIRDRYEISAEVSYDVFDKDISSTWTSVIALNIPLWRENDPTILDLSANAISAYTEADRRLFQIETDPELFNRFISDNIEFVNEVNIPVLDGVIDRYELPLISYELSNQYVDIISSKQDRIPIDIAADDVYVLSSFMLALDGTNQYLELSAYTEPEYNEYGVITSVITGNQPLDQARIICKPITRYVNDPLGYNLRTDLFDIEQYNLGSPEFTELKKIAIPEVNEWKTIKANKIIGPLITIYEFESNCHSRLATNGRQLFFETHYDGDVYRYELEELNAIKDITQYKTTEYNDFTLALSNKLNWLEADEYGIYFNNAYGKRIQLFGDSKANDGDKDMLRSRLTYQSDIASKPESLILKFRASMFAIKLDMANDIFNIKI